MTTRAVTGTAVLVACSIALASCASMYSMRCPGKGGPAWYEVSTAHFRLQTDVDESEARRVAVELEQRRSGLLRAAWHGAEFPSSGTRVVMFRGTNELQEFLIRYIAGYSTLDWAGDELIVLARDSRGGMMVLTHELTHDLGRFYFARQPRWMSEGMARFLETLQIDEERQKVVIGVPDLERRLGPQSSLKRVFEKERENRGATWDSYETGWALIFYLTNYEGAAFNDYQRRLFRGEAPDEAWKAAFPAYATDDALYDLDSKVSAAFKEVHFSRRYKTASAPLVPYAGALSLRKMTDPEVHSVRGELFVQSPHPPHEHDRRRSAAGDEAAEALRQDPAEIRAIALRIQLAPKLDEKLAIAAAAAREQPGDYRALLLDDLALEDETGTAQQEAARTAHLELAARFAPDNVHVLHRLGRAYIRAGHADQAIPLVQHALEMVPDHSEALDAYALIADAQGACPAALALERMAVDRLPHLEADEEKKAPQDQRRLLESWRRMRERLTAFDKQCGTVPPPARPASARPQDLFNAR